MRTPLRDAVKDYLEKDPARFHMPGHKGIGTGEFETILPWDITEVAGADSLFDPEGAILELEKQAAECYGAARSLLCAGGATLCIQTMLALTCGIGGTVIMSRNIHRSAINAAALLDLEPVWIYPEKDAGEGFSGRYSPAAVSAALEANPAACGVYITSPDYFGVISPLGEIAAVCKARGIPLLVDNAHGAHLKWLPAQYGALHPIDCGAALCCDSLHKTLPAMTGGAMLHIKDRRFIPAAKRMMAMFGSTSPSYPILLSCERALCYAQSGAAEGFARVTAAFDHARELARNAGFTLPEGVCDPAKCSIGFAAGGMTAETFGGWLRENGIEPEYIGGAAGVLMATGLNGERDFQRLFSALKKAPMGKKAGTAPVVKPVELPRLRRECSVREATFSTQETVPVENCAGRIAAGELSPCPPGIPIVMPGERLDEETAAVLKRFGILQVNVTA